MKPQTALNSAAEEAPLNDSERKDEAIVCSEDIDISDVSVVSKEIQTSEDVLSEKGVQTSFKDTKSEVENAEIQTSENQDNSFPGDTECSEDLSTFTSEDHSSLGSISVFDKNETPVVEISVVEATEEELVTEGCSIQPVVPVEVKETVPSEVETEGVTTSCIEKQMESSTVSIEKSVRDISPNLESEGVFPSASILIECSSEELAKNLNIRPEDTDLKLSGPTTINRFSTPVDLLKSNLNEISTNYGDSCSETTNVNAEPIQSRPESVTEVDIFVHENEPAVETEISQSMSQPLCTPPKTSLSQESAWEKAKLSESKDNICAIEEPVAKIQISGVEAIQSRPQTKKDISVDEISSQIPSKKETPPFTSQPSNARFPEDLSNQEFINENAELSNSKSIAESTSSGVETTSTMPEKTEEKICVDENVSAILTETEAIQSSFEKLSADIRETVSHHDELTDSEPVSKTIVSISETASTKPKQVKGKKTVANENVSTIPVESETPTSLLQTSSSAVPESISHQNSPTMNVEFPELTDLELVTKITVATLEAGPTKPNIIEQTKTFVDDNETTTPTELKTSQSLQKLSSVIPESVLHQESPIDNIKFSDSKDPLLTVEEPSPFKIHPNVERSTDFDLEYRQQKENSNAEEYDQQQIPLSSVPLAQPLREIDIVENIPASSETFITRERKITKPISENPIERTSKGIQCQQKTTDHGTQNPENSEPDKAVSKTDRATETKTKRPKKKIGRRSDTMSLAEAMGPQLSEKPVVAEIIEEDHEEEIQDTAQPLSVAGANIWDEANQKIELRIHDNDTPYVATLFSKPHFDLDDIKISVSKFESLLSEAEAELSNKDSEMAKKNFVVCSEYVSNLLEDVECQILSLKVRDQSCLYLVVCNR